MIPFYLCQLSKTFKKCGWNFWYAYFFFIHSSPLGPWVPIYRGAPSPPPGYGYAGAHPRSWWTQAGPTDRGTEGVGNRTRDLPPHGLTAYHLRHQGRFWRFLDDWGTKYWWISIKFGIKVVDMGLYDINFVFFSNFLKKGFYLGFPENIGFWNFGGSKTKNFEISRLAWSYPTKTSIS